MLVEEMVVIDDASKVWSIAVDGLNEIFEFDTLLDLALAF